MLQTTKNVVKLLTHATSEIVIKLLMDDQIVVKFGIKDAKTRLKQEFPL